MVTRDERKWVAGFGLLLMLLTSLSYLIGYAAQGEAWVFTGFVFGVEDGNSYLAKMLSGSTGDWLFRTPYSAFPQRGVPALFAYLLLGKLTGAPAQQVQMVALFHLFRFVAGLLMCFASYDFISLFVKRLDLRRWGMALAVAGGGLGWLLLLTGWGDNWSDMPLEIYSPETFGFLMVYGLPHLALGRAALLWGLVAYLRTTPTVVDRGAPGWYWSRQGALVGLWWLLLSFMQPMSVVIAWTVVGVHIGLLWWQGRQGPAADWGQWSGWLRRALVAGLVSAPLVLYTVVAFASDPFAQAWTVQNILHSPAPFQYLLAYGVLLPFVWFGARRLLAADRWRGALLVGWLVILPILVYAPVNVQRRLAEGSWPVMLVVAAVGMADLSQRRSLWRWARPWLFVVLFPMTVFLLLGGVLVAARPAEPLFRPAAEVAFFEQVRAIVEEDALILTAYETGNALPVWVPARVLIGHGPESIGLEELRPRVVAFYTASTPDAERQALLAEFEIEYVYFGLHEGTLGDWQPDQSDYLILVLREAGYALYRVQLDNNTTP